MKTWFALLTALPLVAFAAAQEKIVTLGGDVTEIVYALGADSSLVARDSTSQWPQAANALPDVGYLRQLNAEGILSMRPTLVLASDQAQPSLALKQVERSHVRVITVPGRNDLSVIDEKIRIIAEATHREAQGESLRRSLRQAVAALPAEPLNKRVLFILNHGVVVIQFWRFCRILRRCRHSCRRVAERDAGFQAVSAAVAGRDYCQPARPGGDFAGRRERAGWRGESVEAARTGANPGGTAQTAAGD